MPISFVMLLLAFLQTQTHAEQYRKLNRQPLTIQSPKRAEARANIPKPLIKGLGLIRGLHPRKWV